MVMVDKRRQLQDERCDENGDIRAHLLKLLTLHKDLSAMGTTVDDDDFTVIILGSLPKSYEGYLTAITTTTNLMATPLSPYDLIHAINDEADRRSINTRKSKKDEKDAAFAAGDKF